MSAASIMAVAQPRARAFNPHVRGLGALLEPLVLLLAAAGATALLCVGVAGAFLR
jgi:hypothetical protein